MRIKAFLQRLFLTERPGWQAYGAAIILAFTASLIAYGLEYLTVERFSNINSVLILAVLVSAVLFGTGPAITAAAVCSLLYDWLMVPPFFGTTNSNDDLLKFSLFVTAALLTSWIAGMARKQAVELRRRELELSAALQEREEQRRLKEQEMVQRQVETLRNAVLSAMSHDLKTPLSSIIGATSSWMLYDRELSQEDRRELGNSILGEANRLLGFINNILEMARLENYPARLKSELIAADDVIDLAVKRLATQLRQYDFQVIQDGDALTFRGDERLVSIALGNLLDNAMKFSSPGSRITLRALADAGQVVLAVDDEGVGVPESLRTLVFDKYYRAGQPESSKAGTGLGLWITRRIVEAHGGQVTISTPDNGIGARVTISVPTAGGAELAEALLDAP